MKFDSIILGGGCAGLSLAIQLSKRDPGQKILILEEKKEYTSDRTWCFWNVFSNPFEDQVQYRWKKWQIGYGGEKITQQSCLYEYHCIPSLYFYQKALETIREMKNVTLLMDNPVKSVMEEEEVVVKSFSGSFLTSRVFDSRPSLQETTMFQHFHGWQVVSEEPCFDPSEVILMDFNVSQDQGLNFIYLLPFSSFSALVESTFLSPQTLEKGVYENAIRGYLEEKYGLKSYKIIYKESGVLPLRPQPVQKSVGKIVPIGARGGWMRGSTGYAFLSIHQAIEHLLQSLPMSRKKKVESFLDQIFLSYLKDYPEHAPELFFTFFKKNSPDRMVRFLSGTWSYGDLIRVLSSMPKLKMLKQAWQ